MFPLVALCILADCLCPAISKKDTFFFVVLFFFLRKCTFLIALSQGFICGLGSQEGKRFAASQPESGRKDGAGRW